MDSLEKKLDPLRKPVEALGKKQDQPSPGRQRIVVTSPLAKDVVLTQVYVGKIVAQRHINVRALVTGSLAEVRVQEGQAVTKGDLMFKVLPTRYRAKLDAERREVRLAELDLSNIKKRFKDTLVPQLEVARSKLAKAQARAKIAETELKFTEVRAPFDGLVDRPHGTQGSPVKQGEILASLSDNGAMWVYFSIPVTRYLEYVADREPLKVGSPVEVVLGNRGKVLQAGKIGAIEAEFTNATGSVRVRADFPNADGLMRHGMIGTVVTHRALKNPLVIPQRATFEILDKRYVYVVGKDGLAHQREIVVRHELDGLFIVQKGLDVNDRIVGEGVRQVRADEKLDYRYRKPEEIMTHSKKDLGK
jgi:membrane fusion protein (multidrug efflux system)